MSKKRIGLRFIAWLALACGGLQLATPALAQRGLVIDVAGQSNALGSCGTNCFSLSTGTGNFSISANGSITLLDGSAATFFVASSNTLFQVLSGFTITSLGRIDFVDFYQLGRSTAVNGTGNRDAPDFQIQLRSVPVGGLYPGLEIAFAYLGSTGINNVPAGATIGYSGSTLGVQTLPNLPGSFAGFPAQHLVTNTGGLLLGQRAIDSEFVFLVGPRPNSSFQTVTGLLSETFLPRYAAVASVPEPATWAMMLLGFGAIGSSLRRRRRAPALA